MSGTNKTDPRPARSKMEEKRLRELANDYRDAALAFAATPEHQAALDTLERALLDQEVAEDLGACAKRAASLWPRDDRPLSVDLLLEAASILTRSERRA